MVPIFLTLVTGAQLKKLPDDCLNHEEWTSPPYLRPRTLLPTARHLRLHSRDHSHQLSAQIDSLPVANPAKTLEEEHLRRPYGINSDSRPMKHVRSSSSSSSSTFSMVRYHDLPDGGDPQTLSTRNDEGPSRSSRQWISP